MRAPMPQFFLSFLILFLLLLSSAKAHDTDEGFDPLFEGKNALEIISSEPSTLIYKAVNITSGDFIDFATDLKLPGAESLILQRFFKS